MRRLIAILGCLPLTSLVGANDITPSLSDAERVHIYYLGTSDLNTPPKEVREPSVVRELARLIEHSHGVWQSHSTPWSTGDFQISFYKDQNMIYSVGVGEDFLVCGAVGIPGRTCYIKKIKSDEAKAIRKIVSRVWWSRLTNRWEPTAGRGEVHF
jgi:hypothetical protein